MLHRSDNSSSTAWLPAAACVVAALLLGACDGGSDSAETASAEPEAARPGENDVWFEPILARPYVPKMTTQIVPMEKGRGFFLLGRNADLYHVGRDLEDFPVRDFAEAKEAEDYGERFWKLRMDEHVYFKADLGTIGMALDPDFETNDFMYLWYPINKDEALVLDRYEWTRNKKRFVESRTNIITINRRNPPAPYHMGGIVQFLPDGSLLLAPGDAERPELAQDGKDLNGKLLRIIPRKGPGGGYDVPRDNPHVNDEDIRPEIVAMGLRATFRGYLHEGRYLYTGDVGAGHEEINLWAGGPADYGWGRGKDTDGPNVEPGVTPPLLWWSKYEDFSGEDPRYTGETRVSAAVALVYDRPSVDRYRGRLTGKLVFYELMRGWIRVASLDENDGRILDHEYLGHLQFCTHMVQGRDGYIYAVTYRGSHPVLYRMRMG